MILTLRHSSRKVPVNGVFGNYDPPQIGCEEIVVGFAAVLKVSLHGIARARRSCARGAETPHSGDRRQAITVLNSSTALACSLPHTHLFRLKAEFACQGIVFLCRIQALHAGRTRKRHFPSDSSDFVALAGFRSVNVTPAPRGASRASTFPSQTLTVGGGTFISSAQKIFKVSGDFAQSTIASSDGSFGISGTATFDMPCFSAMSLSRDRFLPELSLGHSRVS